MQLIDIKNDLAKIVYTPISRDLRLADFLIVSDESQNLMAQVISIESTKQSGANAAVVKFILSVDKEGVINPYNGYVPSKNSQVSYMEPEEIVQLLKLSDETLPWGYLAGYENAFVSLDLNMLKNKTYIQCDDADNNANIVNNIISGLQKNHKKVVLLDFCGEYSKFSITKYTVAKDFKMPLNYNALEYIYNNDLDALDLQSRTIIQDILLDLQKYVKETKDKFLPFNTFLRVVDAEYKKNPSVGITLIRNKLLKYAQSNLFAQNKQDFTVLSDLLMREDVLYLDISSFDSGWQKIILEFITEQLDQECFLILNLNELNSDKTLISKLFSADRVFYPIVISLYSYPEAQFIKGLANNLILFAPIRQSDDFATYNSFLSKLNDDEFIVCGRDTLNIPLIIKLSLFENPFVSYKTRQEIVKSVDDIFRGKKPEQIDTYNPSEHIIINEQVEPDGETFITDFEDREIIDPDIQGNLSQDDDVLNFIEEGDEDDINPLIDVPAMSMDEINPPVEIIEDDDENEIINTSGNLGEELSGNDVVTTIPEKVVETESNSNDEIDDLPELKADLPQQNVTTEIPSLPDVPEIIETQEENSEIDYDAIFSDEDLDFIDELNEETENSNVPIYEATVESKEPDPNVLPPELCKEGTFVFHQKYGKGMIEKVINYGNKTLCSIQFDNVGRRLLDPNLAELKEV